MALLNWPPSKGPKPPHLDVIERRVEPGRIVRTEFDLKQSRLAVTERKILLEAIGNPEVEKRNPGIKIGTPSAPLPKGKGVRLIVAKKKKLKTLKPGYERVFELNHQVAMVSTLTAGQARKLIHGVGKTFGGLESDIEPRPIMLALDYPLSKGLRLAIHPYDYIVTRGDGKERVTKELTIGYVLWVIAQEYLKIYEDWRHFGIWGHAIEDLYFEGLEVHKNGLAYLRMGS